MLVEVRLVWYTTLSKRNVTFHSTEMLFVDSTCKTGNWDNLLFLKEVPFPVNITSLQSP